MASLKQNIQTIHEGLSKNITIVLGQAKEKARVAAFDYMQNRNNPKLSAAKNEVFENTNAVIAWLTKLEGIVNEVPQIHEDEAE